MPYDRRCGHWLEFFGFIADRVTAEIGPKKVLDVGCAKGFLVEALRDRGIEAFGIDISEYAISEVRADIRPYCRVASAVDPFDDQYDLIICIEVLEHLTEEEGRQALANIRRSSGDVLFSSTPDDFEEPTHVTVRPRFYWIEQFAEHGLYLDVVFDAGFIAPHAMRFRKGEVAVSLQRIIGWKRLERLRQVRDRLLPHGSRPRKAYGAFCRVVEVLLDEGPRAFFKKTGYKIHQALRRGGVLLKVLPQEIPQDVDAQYRVWLQRHRLTRQDIARIKAAVQTFAYVPLISIITPVYNTDETWLRKAIESVRAQIYPRWELCLVNDASTKPDVRSILDEYAAANPRFRVRHLPRNEGIVGASTHALSLATGEFVGLLDHDDELSPDALFEVVKRLNEDPDLDLLYSDEDKLEPDGRRVEPFFKPDWSPDLLLSMNYITHFSVFRRSLLGKIGGFRGGFDGSQDYDLLLRFTEGTGKIAHIPKILYHWRKIPGSAAASNAAKSPAYEAGRQAIEDTIRRRGYEGRVESIMPGRYTVRYHLYGTPLVSIIIPTRDQRELLQQCLRSVEKETSYPQYEILILDNDSNEPETLKYLDAIAEKWRVYRYPGLFNFSAINNFGAAQARGDYLLFLNNDIQVIGSDWLIAMLEQAQRLEVGAVGGKLLYPDGRIQHAGVVLGIGGVAGHAFKYSPGDPPSYFSLSSVVRNCSAVSAACMMVRRQVFKEIGGLDERFRVAFNDVDLCLRLRQRGYLIVYTPLALLYHRESASRGRLHPSEDEELCWKLWGDLIRAGDPYYNPNLTLSREDWSLRL
jgi:GT2 family glycosyltransferase